MSWFLTPEQLEAIRQDWETTTLVSHEIAKKHKINVDYPRRLARKHKWGQRPAYQTGGRRPAEWTQEDEAKAVELLSRGRSASEVSQALGGKFSRSAVIGKAHRMGWPRAKPVQAGQRSQMLYHKPKATRQRRVTIMPVALSPELRKRPWTALEGSNPVSLFHRCGCKWPIDGQAEQLFCDLSIHQDNANGWCEQHLTMGLDFRPKASVRGLERLARRAA